MISMIMIIMHVHYNMHTMSERTFVIDWELVAHISIAVNDDGCVPGSREISGIRGSRRSVRQCLDGSKESTLVLYFQVFFLSSHTMH